jgi:hypothetical protein
MERRQDEAITVVVEIAGVLDAGGVEDGHRVLLDTAVRGGGGGGGGGRRARGRHSAEVWARFLSETAGQAGTRGGSPIYHASVSCILSLPTSVNRAQKLA